MNRLVLLGVKGGPSLRPGGAMPTSSLLELDGRRIVIDCGLGVSKALVEAGVPLRELDLIFITHLHSDHLLELGPLLHTAWVTGQQKSVTVYGPPGLQAYWEGFCASMAYDIHLRITDDGRAPLSGFVQIEEIAPGPVAVEGLRVSAFAVKHPPVDHAFAFRFDGSVSVTFSGDTTYFPPLADFAKGTDVLVHEGMLPEGIDLILEKTGGGEKLRAHLNASHTVVDDAARIASAAGAGQLALHHLVPVDDPRFTEADWKRRATLHYGGPVTVGSDGLEIAL